MDNYIIRFATTEDIPDIMSFINQYWKSGHILGTDRSFFEYEHKIDKNRINFAIACDHKSNEIFCICGFLQSCKEISRGSIWDVIWKKKPETPRGMGIEVINYIRENCGTPYDFFVGANPATIPLHVKRGYFVDKLHHYYRLSSDNKFYSIANISNRLIPAYDTSTSIKLCPILEGNALEEIVENNKLLPHKDYWYICKRYIHHPIYKYNLWALKYADGSANSVLITRTVKTDMGNALRIIDYIGLHSELGFIGSEIDRLMREYKCEYSDIYCYGVNVESLSRMGFVQRIHDDVNIIPNYFEPFVNDNIDIIFASPLKDGFCIFKGDADQDRPNIIK